MVFGPATGRPKSAVFRTADVVGLDTLRARHQELLRRPARATSAARCSPRPPCSSKLVEKKWLGAKTKQGFYKKVGDDILQLDLKTLEYGPQKKPRFASIGAARGADDVDEKLRRMVAGNDRAAALARTVLYETLIYAANRLGEIADERRRHRPRAALGLRLGARAVRDLGRARRQGDRRQDGGRRLHRARLGAGADRRPGRGDALLPHGGARQAARSSASAAASPPIADRPAPPLARRHARRRRRGRAQRQRVDPRSRRRRLLPRVPRQDERHRSRHRRA